MLNIGLLCRILAPMLSAERMRQIATGVDLVDREDAAYWLSIAMHRKNPRRVLNALRLLLTRPNENSPGRIFSCNSKPSPSIPHYCAGRDA